MRSELISRRFLDTFEHLNLSCYEINHKFISDFSLVSITTPDIPRYIEKCVSATCFYEARVRPKSDRTNQSKRDGKLPRWKTTFQPFHPELKKKRRAQFGHINISTNILSPIWSTNFVRFLAITFLLGCCEACLLPILLCFRVSPSVFSEVEVKSQL